MALTSHAATAIIGFIVAILSGIGPLLAQETQTSPRTPMSPGSAKILMAPTDRDRALWGMNPPHILQPPTALSPPTQSPDLSGLDAAAITLVASGGTDVVVSSRAGTELILQLYRPDQNQWQEFRVPPSTNTPIACAACGGKLKFSFNDGAQDSEINVEAPAMLRIFPDATGKRWQWDVFKLQAAAESP